MGNYFSSNGQQINISQSIVNDVLQKVNNECVNSCQTIHSGDINIVNSKIAGNFEIDLSCSVIGNTCVMKTTVENTIENTLDAIAKQVETIESDFTSLSIGSDNNEKASIEQAIKNAISQVVNNNCQENTGTTYSGAINIVGSSLGGNFLIQEDSKISSNTCSINNMLKNFIKNSESASVSQSLTSAGLLMILAGIITTIVTGLVIVMIVTSTTKSATQIFKKKDTSIETDNTYDPTTGKLISSKTISLSKDNPSTSLSSNPSTSLSSNPSIPLKTNLPSIPLKTNLPSIPLKTNLPSIPLKTNLPSIPLKTIPLSVSPSGKKIENIKESFL